MLERDIWDKDTNREKQSFRVLVWDETKREVISVDVTQSEVRWSNKQQKWVLEHQPREKIWPKC